MNQKKIGKNLFFGILKATEEMSMIRIRNSVYGFKDQDPYKNVTDPEHWITGLKKYIFSALPLICD